MDEDITRREFLLNTVAGPVGLAAASGLAETSSREDAVSTTDFGSRWHLTHDRVWPGEDYWSNPLQDWRIASGRLECVRADVDRNVHLLTRQLGERPGELRMAVRIGRTGRGVLGAGPGSFGFRIGIQGPLCEYRNNALFGTGLDAGLTADGRLFIDHVNAGERGTVDLGREAIELHLVALPRGEDYEVTLTVADLATGDHLGEYSAARSPRRGWSGTSPSWPTTQILAAMTEKPDDRERTQRPLPGLPRRKRFGSATGGWAARKSSVMISAFRPNSLRTVHPQPAGAQAHGADAALGPARFSDRAASGPGRPGMEDARGGAYRCRGPHSGVPRRGLGRHPGCSLQARLHALLR